MGITEEQELADEHNPFRRTAKPVRLINATGL
jgi:hypothetical protein